MANGVFNTTMRSQARGASICECVTRAGVCEFLLIMSHSCKYSIFFSTVSTCDN